MGAMVIGMSVYLMVTAALAVIIVAGLRLLDWVMSGTPARLGGSQRWSDERGNTIPLRQRVHKI